MGLLDNLRTLLTPVEVKAVDNVSVNISNLPDYGDFTDIPLANNYTEQFFGWTYRAITVIAESVASREIPLYNKDSKGNYKRIETSPFLEDLYHFNHFQTFTDARRLTVIYRRLTGSAYWLIVKSKSAGYKYEFYVLDPMRMEIKVGKDGLPQQYRYQDRNGKYQEYELDDIVVFNSPNPMAPYTGWSDLEATRYAHNVYKLIHQYNLNTFGNMGMPKGLLQIANIGDTEKERLEKKFEQKFGGVRNAGKFGITNTGTDMKWVQMGQPTKDLDYVAGMNMVRDEILAIQGVPKPLVGLTDSTYNNMAEAQRVYQMTTLSAELSLEESTFNEQLIRKYYSPGKAPQGICFKHDDPVDKDFAEDAKAAGELYKAGVIDRAQAKQTAGFEPNESDKEVYATQGSNIPEMPAKSIKSVGGDREALKAFFHTKTIDNENDFAAHTRRFFREQKDRVLTEYAKEKSVTMKFFVDKESEVDITVDFFRTAYMQVADHFNDIANDLGGTQTGISRVVRQALNANLDYFATEITDTTLDDLKRIIARGVEEDLSTADVAREIEALYGRWIDGGEGLTETRSEMIARTEVGGIKNLTARGNYAQNEAVEGMEWLTAQDRDVRDSHRYADGQVVPKGAKFKVGGEYLAYPGDRSGSADNTINCRCTLIPVIN